MTTLSQEAIEKSIAEFNAQWARATKKNLTIRAARVMGLLYATPAGSDCNVFTDNDGNVVEFDPIGSAEDSEKLMCQSAVSVKHYSNGVVCSTDKLKPWVCLLKDFNDDRVTTLRWCIAFAAAQFSDEVYGDKFFNQQSAGQE